MVKNAHLFNQFHKRRILVAGDFMMDRYTFGASKRISPEAPVPVVLVEKEEDRAGGAGNVVLNLTALGMEVTALGRVGDDSAGQALKHSLRNEGVLCESLFSQKGLMTPQKTRVIAGGQQIVRVDFEKIEPIDSTLEKHILASIPGLVAGSDVIAISDYAKGFLTDAIIQKLIQEARKAHVPVIADPKGAFFGKYAHATILKPNLQEAYTAVNMHGRPLPDVAQAIFKAVPVDMLMITRSQDGISIFFADGTHEEFPVQVRQVRDVTGAGDTVLAMVACGCANGFTISESTFLASLAAQIAVERLGCAVVTMREVAKRYIDEHTRNKIFTDEHRAALAHATNGHKVTKLTIPKGTEISTELIRTVRGARQDAGQDPDTELVIHLPGAMPDDDLTSMLASLKEVDYIFVGDS